MPQANVIRWRDGAGWLILSGGADDSGIGDVEAQALERAMAGEPLAYVWAADDIEAADQQLAALQELGAPTGYLIDILGEDDATLRKQFDEAGLIVLGDGPDQERLRSGLIGAAIEGIGAAYERGAVILAVGSGASVLGSLNLTNDKPGMGWIDHAIVAPNYDTEGQALRLHNLLLKHPDSYGLGIGAGSALVLGSQGQIETWGKRSITVKLGSNAV